MLSRLSTIPFQNCNKFLKFYSTVNNDILVSTLASNSSSYSHSVVKEMKTKLLDEKKPKTDKPNKNTLLLQKENLMKHEDSVNIANIDKVVSNQFRYDNVPAYKIKYLFAKNPEKSLKILMYYVDRNFYQKNDIDLIYNWIKNTKYFLNPQVSDLFLEFYTGKYLCAKSVQELIGRLEQDELEFTQETFSHIFNYFLMSNDNDTGNSNQMLHYWLQKLSSHSEFIPDLSLILIRSYLHLNNYEKAMELYNKFEHQQKSLKDFYQIVDFLVEKKKLDLVLKFFLDNVAGQKMFLKSQSFMKFLCALWDENYNIKKEIIDFLTSNSMMDVYQYRYCIGWLLDPEIEMSEKAYSLYDYYLQNNTPSFSLYNIFIKYHVRKNNLEECMTILSNMKKINIFSDVVIDFSILELAQRIGDTQNLRKIIDNIFITEHTSKKVSFIIIYCQVNGYNIIFEEILKRMLNPNFPRNTLSIVTNQIIRDYLRLDRYDMALKWFGDRITIFNLFPNKYTIDFFHIYHLNTPDNTRDKENLINFWKAKREQYRVEHLIEDEAVETYLHFDINTIIESIDKFTPSGQLKLKLSHYGQSVPTPEQLQLYRMSQLNTNLLTQKNTPSDNALNTYYNIHDYDSMGEELLIYIKNDVIPKGDLLLRCILEISKFDHHKYFYIIKIASSSMRAIIFHDQLFAETIKSNLDYGVSTLRPLDRKLYYYSSMVWDAFAIGLLQISNLNLAMKVLGAANLNHSPLNALDIKDAIDSPSTYRPIKQSTERFITNNFINRGDPIDLIPNTQEIYSLKNNTPELF